MYAELMWVYEYRYMEDLLELDMGRRVPTPDVPPSFMSNLSRLSAETWHLSRAEHPDTRLKEYVINGMRDGFRIRYDYTNTMPANVQRRTCMLSTLEHPEVVRKYIAEECAEGRLLGPFDPASLPSVQVSRFGVIPKNTPGKWRLILDLLWPEGHGVNDSIDPDLISLSYVSIDDAARAATRLGQGALLAKVDIKSAYRTVPVHPEDRLLCCRMKPCKWMLPCLWLALNAKNF